MPRIFCYWHIATKENLAGTDCSAHLAEGRVFKCPYKSLADAAKQRFPCMDAEPLRPEV
jgi:hypothetical protein